VDYLARQSILIGKLTLPHTENAPSGGPKRSPIPLVAPPIRFKRGAPEIQSGFRQTRQTAERAVSMPKTPVYE
jgi:hypothetical protein